MTDRRTLKQQAADEACKVAFAHHQAARKVLARAIANRDRTIRTLTDEVVAAQGAEDVAWAEYGVALKTWTETR